MGARPLAEVTLMRIDRRTQNPGMTVTAGAFTVQASGGIREDKYLKGLGWKLLCLKSYTGALHVGDCVSHMVSIFNLADTCFSQKRNIQFREVTPTNSKLKVDKK